MATRITSFLSSLLIDDLVKVQGMKGLKYPDRLTRAEASQILDWGKAQPALRKAFDDKSDPTHANVRLFVDMLQHFAGEHPQGANGEPAAWAARAPSSRQATAEDPFGDLHQDEAAALLVYGQSHPDYVASYHDPKHAGHADIVGKTSALMRVVHPEQGEASAPAALPAARQEGTAAMSNTIDELMKAPAYADKRHPEHQAAVDAVTRAYEQQSGPSPVSGAGATSGGTPAGRVGAGDVTAKEQITARYGDKAFMARYGDRHDPGHGEAVAEMAQLFETAHPAPAES